MRRKNDESDRGSFLEYLAETLWRVFKKAFELFIKVIKKIVKEVWSNA